MSNKMHTFLVSFDLYMYIKIINLRANIIYRDNNVQHNHIRYATGVLPMFEAIFSTDRYDIQKIYNNDTGVTVFIVTSLLLMTYDLF